MTRRTSRSRTASCCRCSNEDDLETVRGRLYCRPCRTCPHDFQYIDFWDPACPECVRDMFTILGLNGPRITNLQLYVQTALRWGIPFSEIRVHTFEEQDRLETWEGFKNEPFHKWTLESPPHFSERR